MHWGGCIESRNVVDGHVRVLPGQANDGADGLSACAIREEHSLADVEPSHADVMRRIFAEPRDAASHQRLRAGEEAG